MSIAWAQEPSGPYRLAASDPDADAPAVARALVNAGADILSIAESRHSLEDVYLKLVDEDVEAKRRWLSLLYMLMIPAMVPSVLAAYAVVGEREQGTLEPVFITPIHREEFLVGKALAVLVPTLGIACLVFGIFLGVAAIFAQPGAASAVFEGSHLLVQLLFTPLLAGWSIWAGIAISARSADVRAAQQLGVLASLPPLVIVALMSFNVIVPTLGLALALACALLLVDVLGWRVVAAMFDRERLITGTRS